MEFGAQFLPIQVENRRLHGPESHLLPQHYTEQDLFGFLTAFNGFANYDDLKLDVPEHMPVEQMASNPVTMAFLQFLIVFRGAKRVLELGSYIGASAIKMAQVLPVDGSVLTVEKGKEFADYARRNTTGLLIQVEQGDALERVTIWSGHHVNHYFDMIYLDCDKEHYDEYLEPLSKLLKPGGLLVVDDVLFHGDVLNETPTTDKGKGCKRLLEKAKIYDWPKVLLPLTNGLLLMEKPR